MSQEDVYTIKYHDNKAYLLKNGAIYKQIFAEPPSLVTLQKNYPDGESIDAKSTMEIERLFPIDDPEAEAEQE